MPRDGSVRSPDAPTTDARAIDAAPAACTNDLPCAGMVTTAMCNGGCWSTCTNGFGVSMLSVALACADWGGEAAPITSAADQACVETTLFPQQASWIGLVQGPGAATVDGNWTVANMAATYTNWDTGQPNDGNGSENGQEQCASMGTNGKWQDTDCASTALVRFSCRR